jgi:hypothetical protein
MKKILTIIIIVLLIGAAAYGGYYGYKTFIAMKKSVADILPQGPLHYIHFKNTEQLVTDFSSTEFWKSFSNIDFETIMKKGRYPEGSIEAFKNFQKYLAEAADQEMVRNFFGQEFAVAVYPTNKQVTNPMNFSQVLENMMFITRMNTEAKLAQSFSGVFMQFADNVSEDIEEYKKHEVHVLKIDGDFLKVGEVKLPPLEVGYVRINDYFIFGLGKRAARACIDTIEQKEVPSLAEGDLFQKAQNKHIAGADILGFMNLDMFSKRMKMQAYNALAKMPENVEQAKNQVDEYFKQWQGVDGIGYSASFEDLARMKIDLFYQKEGLHADIKPLYDCIAINNESIRLVPQEVLGYHWQSCLDVKSYWNAERKKLEARLAAEQKEITMDQIIQQFENKFKLSIENDIIPALGQEFGGYLTDIDTKAPYPIPQLVLFMEISDQAKAQGIIETFINFFPIFQAEEKEYSGTKIKYFNIPLLNNLSPSYALVGDYLMLSTNKDLLEQSIDARGDNEKAFLAHVGSAVVKDAMQQPINSAFYLRTDRFVAKVEELLDWVGEFVEARVIKKEAFKTGAEKRLADVQNEIAAKEAQIQEWQQEVQRINAALKAREQVDTTSLTDLVGKIKAAESEIEDIRFKEEDLREDVESINVAEIEKSKDQLILINDIIKPIIKTFRTVEYLAVKAAFSEEVVESITYLKVK